MIRVAHVITNLDMGGAQSVLRRVVEGLDRRRFRPLVVSLEPIGTAGTGFEATDVPIHSLGMRPGVPDPRAIPRLAALLRSSATDVVQSWMYHADLVSGLAAPIAGRPGVIWGLRAGEFDRSMKLHTRLTIRTCARLSNALSDRILCCSEASRRIHATAGYTRAKMVLVPNGFDVDLFAPSCDRRAAVRAELNIGDNDLVVGNVGRWHPQKDYPSLFAALATVRHRVHGVHVALCGKELTPNNRELTLLCRAAGIAERQVHLLGVRPNVAHLLPAFDVLVSSSAFGEGFPNVVGEAMAAGVPCVVTDVGDSAIVVGETGRVAPPRDPAALAREIAAMLTLDGSAREALGVAARRRIADRYSIAAMVKAYEDLAEVVATERTSVIRFRGTRARSGSADTH